MAEQDPIAGPQGRFQFNDRGGVRPEAYSFEYNAIEWTNHVFPAYERPDEDWFTWQAERGKTRPHMRDFVEEEDGLPVTVFVCGLRVEGEYQASSVLNSHGQPLRVAVWPVHPVSGRTVYGDKANACRACLYEAEKRRQEKTAKDFVMRHSRLAFLSPTAHIHINGIT